MFLGFLREKLSVPSLGEFVGKGPGSLVEVCGSGQLSKQEPHAWVVG